MKTNEELLADIKEAMLGEHAHFDTTYQELPESVASMARELRELRTQNHSLAMRLEALLQCTEERLP